MRASLPLAIVLMMSSAAFAQPAPGWVDPPAKSARPDLKPETKAAPEPAPQAAAPAPEEEAAEPQVRSRPTRRARTASRPSRPAPEAAAQPMASTALPEGRLAESGAAAQALVLDYLESVSAPGAVMLGTAPRYYAPQVRFYGRVTGLPALLAEKRRFVQRWPERRYQPRPGATRTACSAALGLCRVETVIDYRAANPGRGLVSQGVMTAVFEVGFPGGRPVIVSETGRVVARAGDVS
ncbi:hypothetical protein AOPFMNJM_2033 [Methylobacterium jeotgali]|uniref:Uncharacterized protein n=3 Tax=Pseudomonadota TaxID=1224 RepID=A0ABQ4SYG9_9HYPH|nr:hypothetical protein AwMethylo_16980 [Methylobacterium sp.]GJE06711.1 hypothetical protein AOPFMNJM_2033 [Methylobacterium jeotgali]